MLLTFSCNPSATDGRDNGDGSRHTVVYPAGQHAHWCHESACCGGIILNSRSIYRAIQVVDTVATTLLVPNAGDPGWDTHKSKDCRAKLFNIEIMSWHTRNPRADHKRPRCRTSRKQTSRMHRELTLINLLLTADSAKEFLTITVSREADSGSTSRTLDACALLPVLQVNSLDADFFFERLGFLILILLLFLAGLIVASWVIRVSATENTNDQLHDQAEPRKRNSLEYQQERQEAKVDVLIVANNALGISERFKQMTEACRLGQWPGKILACALETAKGDVDWNVNIDAPADHEVEHVAGHEPRKDEEAKHQVAGSGEAKILQAFRELVES